MLAVADVAELHFAVGPLRYGADVGEPAEAAFDLGSQKVLIDRTPGAEQKIVFQGLLSFLPNLLGHDGGNRPVTIWLRLSGDRFRTDADPCKSC